MPVSLSNNNNDGSFGSEKQGLLTIYYLHQTREPLKKGAVILYMTNIEIKLIVLNPQEIVEREKGKLADWFSKWFIDKDKVRREVEKAVALELIKELEIKLPKALAERGVKAELHFSVSDSKEPI